MNEIITGIIVAVSVSLINFVSIKIYNYFTGESRNFIWKNKYKRLNKIFNSINDDELRKRIRIVVIDDEDSFPIALLQTDGGYAVDKWDKVNDYNKLETGFYDIIVLDIRGVAEHISEDDGLGVLIDLKRKNPAQIIISYSQHSYDLNKIKFFQQADENISKPSDYLKIKSTINDLITTKFRAERYIKCIDDLLSNSSLRKNEIKKIKNEISKSITKRKTLALYGKYDFLDGKTDLTSQITTLTNTLSKFY